MTAMTNPEPARKPRVLFMAEAVTLAHVARPHVLANALDRDAFEVLFASDPRYDALFPDALYPKTPLHTIPNAAFREALRKGSPLYDRETLERYVAEDLKLIDAFAPDAIVGDFRLSLSVSARLRGVPYLGISNAYWSPHAGVRFYCPELPMTRFLGHRLADPLFRLVRPIGFALHARPLNGVRRAHGLPKLGLDVRYAYTDADVVLCADAAELYAVSRFPANHHFVGPILWSPAIRLPSWWDTVDRERATIYLTLGSSGDAELLPSVLAGLSKLPVNVIVSTAGEKLPTQPPPNAYLAEYLPGAEAAALASLVICNGGSPTTHQALAAGVPVVGIPGNLDQLLNMAVIEQTGAGRMLRPSSAMAERIPRVASELMDNPATAPAVERVQQAFQRHSAPDEFVKILVAACQPK